MKMHQILNRVSQGESCLLVPDALPALAADGLAARVRLLSQEF